MTRLCPRCNQTQRVYENTVFVKNAKLVIEFCECGQELSKQRVPVKFNPANFIRREDGY